jgi:hypothetical protein
MQLPQLFRRGVVVPLSDWSADQLSQWTVDDFVAVGFVPIGDQVLFDLIWDAGVFHAINAACATRIDDYEEEVLPCERLPSAITTLTSLIASTTDRRVHSFVSSLITICRLAKETERSVYFVL